MKQLYTSKLTAFALSVLLFIFCVGCSGKSDSSSRELPKDLLGISVGMSRSAALQRLGAIAQMESEQRKTGQLWRLANDPHFQYLSVGYDKENKVRFVTGLVDPATAKERLRFAEVGDTTRAEQEINEPHRRYIWKIDADGDKPAYFVTVYGTDPEYLSMYSLGKLAGQTNKSQGDEDDE